VLVRGLNALAATITTPGAAPVIAGVRLRGGRANTARGAAGFAAAAVATAREAGCAGALVVRMDSGFYGGKVIAAIRRAGAFFSVTARMSPALRAAIAAIGEDAWTPVMYPRAIFDDQLKTWVSDAQVAQTSYTAFAGTENAVTARLIVRRVRDQNNKAAHRQEELFRVWRYHAVLTDPRSRWSKPRNSTATTPSSSRSSPTWPTGPWPTCPQGRSPPMPPGWPWPPSPTT
jgi:hypothetical protein